MQLVRDPDGALHLIVSQGVFDGPITPDEFDEWALREANLRLTWGRWTNRGEEGGDN
jgi:hypothetical protein